MAFWRLLQGRARAEPSRPGRQILHKKDPLQGIQIAGSCSPADGGPPATSRARVLSEAGEDVFLAIEASRRREIQMPRPTTAATALGNLRDRRLRGGGFARLAVEQSRQGHRCGRLAALSERHGAQAHPTDSPRTRVAGDVVAGIGRSREDEAAGAAFFVHYVPSRLPIDGTICHSLMRRGLAPSRMCRGTASAPARADTESTIRT